MEVDYYAVIVTSEGEVLLDIPCGGFVENDTLDAAWLAVRAPAEGGGGFRVVKDRLHGPGHCLTADEVFHRASEAQRAVRDARESRKVGEALAALQDQKKPIPMLLWCPAAGCHARHIDAGEFATRPHRTHRCESCGLLWRPAAVPTVGVQFLPGEG